MEGYLTGIRTDMAQLRLDQLQLHYNYVTFFSITITISDGNYRKKL
jgi:hypothetical protein